MQIKKRGCQNLFASQVIKKFHIKLLLDKFKEKKFDGV